MSKSLSRKKIGNIAGRVQTEAARRGLKLVLIGGSLFAFMGLKRSKTPDVDFASSGDLGKTHFRQGYPGQYFVDGVKVDVIHKVVDGIRPLYDLAINKAFMHHGIWCTTPTIAAAIKMCANRPKDREHLRAMHKLGQIDLNTVCKIVRKYAPASDGAMWLAKGGRL